MSGKYSVLAFDVLLLELLAAGNLKSSALLPLSIAAPILTASAVSFVTSSSAGLVIGSSRDSAARVFDDALDRFLTARTSA